MSHAFADHFSGVSDAYARFRPRYPAALFAYLVSLTPGRGLAWDCATGSGQAARSLADHFERVVATDASPRQLEQAVPHERIEYSVAPAEHSGLETGSVDLVNVAQALHWFDLDAFYAEADRVLRPGGVLAVWCCARLEVDSPEIQAVLDDFYSRTVGPYWPSERRLVEDGYRSLAFPVAEVEPPPFAMAADFALPHLAGYLRTWSATQRYRAATGADPVDGVETRLAAHWGEPDEIRTICWPIALRVGRRAGADPGAGRQYRPSSAKP